MTWLPGSMLEFCSSLTKLEVSSAVTEVGICAFNRCENLVIYGQAGSYIQQYAEEEGIPFVAQ